MENFHFDHGPEKAILKAELRLITEIYTCQARSEKKAMKESQHRWEGDS